MATSGNANKAEVDRLYGLALEQFTSARDELARRLRKEGDRDAAEEMSRLRKPTVAAWALNQVRRRDPELVDELIAAGRRLRDAQEQLLTGGDRGSLRAAAADERGLVEQLAQLAERYLIENRHAASATLRGKLSDTLHAVAGDSQARELLSSGRLVRDYQISDLGLDAVPEPSTTTTATRSASSTAGEARPRPQARDSRRTELERKASDIRRALEKARRLQRQREQELEDAERRARDASEAAARAASAAEREMQRAKRSQRAAAEAAERADQLEAELSRLAPEASGA